MSLRWLLLYRVRLRSRSAGTIHLDVLLVLLVLVTLSFLLTLRPSLKFFLTKERVPSPNQKPYYKKPKAHQKIHLLKRSMFPVQWWTKETSVKPWFMGGGKRQPQHHDPQAKVFPEDAPGNDRIVEQLMLTFPKNNVLPLKTIYLPNGFIPWHTTPGRNTFLNNKCPVDRCTLTEKSRDAETADAIIFRDEYSKIHHYRDPQQIWILYYLENPYNTPKNSWQRNKKSDILSLDVFNWTATYRRDSDIVTPYGKFVYHNPNITERELEKNYAANKTKKVAMFVSNCWASNNRLEFAKNLSNYIQVDMYGRCPGGLPCRRTDPKCLEKLDLEYKFYLAFENANCQDYITEKFYLNGLSHDVIPIVMGARPSEYAAVAPPNSYIHVEEFANPKALAEYLHMLDKNDTLYNSYFKWKGTGEFIDTFFWCRVCAMLHASERRNRTLHYTDVEAWWRKGTCTRGEWRKDTGKSKFSFFSSL